MQAEGRARSVRPSITGADDSAGFGEAFSGGDLAVLACKASLANRTHPAGALRPCSTSAECDSERSAQLFRNVVSFTSSAAALVTASGERSTSRS